MKKVKKFLSVLLGVFTAFSCFACGDGKSDESEKKPDAPNNPSITTPTLQPAAEKEWQTVTTYSKDVLSAYLQPIWYTREVYDESVAMIGETGSVNLLYLPKGDVIVRDYKLEKTYEEGKDFTIDGKKITRIKGGNLPFCDASTYDKNGVNTQAPIRYHLNISYHTDEMWEGAMPEAQVEKVSKFMNKVKTEKAASIMYYGDSITVGCSASDSDEGGHINPRLPIWANLMTAWLEETYDADIQTWNTAEGGWLSLNGLGAFDDRVMSVGATNIDLLVLGFGMNDIRTSRQDYIANMKEMVDTYLTANPNGSVVLVAPMNPNTQNTNWMGNQRYMEEWLTEDIADKYDNVAIAQVNSVFTQLETSGKLTRDWLANNINHPNDFGVRIYAQVLLKTLAGDDFCKEIYA